MPERPTLREIFWALLRVTFTTANGVIYFAGLVTVAWLIYMWGHPDWIFIAVIDVYFAFVFVRYPLVPAIYVVILALGTVIEPMRGRQIPWSTYGNFAGACILALVLALGIRMLLAVLWQTVRTMLALAKLAAIACVFAVVFGGLTPVGVPLAALTLGAIASAFWVGMIAVGVLEALMPTFEERTDRFLNSISLPPFSWSLTPFGRLEALALQRRAARQRDRLTAGISNPR